MRSFQRTTRILCNSTRKRVTCSIISNTRYYASGTQSGKDDVKTYGNEVVREQDTLPSYKYSDKQLNEREAIPKEATVLKYHRYGDPLQVLQLEKEPLPESIPKDHTLVRILMAPIHWMDINQIQGHYPSSASPSTLPATPGSECLASVLSSSSSSLSPGDHVIPIVPSLGTWRSHAIFPTSSLIKVPQNIKPEYASSLLISPCTALRLLADFPPPKGSTILVNSSNSLVSQTLIQLAAKQNLNVIAVIRDRPSYWSLSERLKSLGATLVIKEEDFSRGREFFEGKILDEKFGKILVAYDGVGGRSGREMMRWLDNGGKLIVYGGMGRKGVSLGAGELIWNDKSVQGFWMEGWRRNGGDVKGMVREMWKGIEGDGEGRNGVRMWMERWMFGDWKAAVGRAMGVGGERAGEGVERGRDRKVVMVMKGHEFVNRELEDDVIQNSNNNNNN
eukprot:TRINITY_DN1089_c0_g1_i1.p1 TRINITY_DN1089_c0_g1~~TRINITY_DN1089_c0_g1_i1.p1  ORF type:complete len:448 (-),score=160.26 TRINITY_DN1089_c0_g1_i1:7-1350(-)